MEYDKINLQVKKMLSHDRYVHSLGVVDAAEKLAKTYSTDVKKARIAAICHDCAKEMEKTELIRIAEGNEIKLDNILLRETHLLHGPVGSVIAREKFKVEDSEVLDAIRFHTTGRANMTLLEKIIYLSDIIEIGRRFEGIQRIRERSLVNIDEAMLMAIDGTIKHVIWKNSLLHPLTVEARNSILINRND